MISGALRFRRTLFEKHCCKGMKKIRQKRSPVTRCLRPDSKSPSPLKHKSQVSTPLTSSVDVLQDVQDKAKPTRAAIMYSDWRHRPLCSTKSGVKAGLRTVDGRQQLSHSDRWRRTFCSIRSAQKQSFFIVFKNDLIQTTSIQSTPSTPIFIRSRSPTTALHNFQPKTRSVYYITLWL
jgi:hypothetical protein